MGCKIVDGRAGQITDVCQDENGCPRFEPIPADRTIGITYREYPKSTIRTNLNNLNSYSVNVTGNEGQVCNVSFRFSQCNCRASDLWTESWTVCTTFFCCELW